MTDAGIAVAADGANIAYQVSGSGSPVVLLAGQANNHHWWDSVVSGFAARHQTIAIDYRGTGDSDSPPGHYSTQRFAEDAIAVLDHLGVDRAHVYGTSMGGRVAQHLAADHPDRVDRLVLGCTSPGGPHSIEPADAVTSGLAQPDPVAARQFLAELMYSPAFLATHPGPFGTLGDPHMSASARRRHRRASAEHDAWDMLPSITAPTLIAHGGDDRLTPPANAALLAQRIPTAQTVLITGARHAYFEERAAQATDLVLRFLNDPL